MDFQSIEIQTERLRLAGYHNGVSAGVPIVALHGWLDNAASFEPLAEHLDIDQPFYAMELPGHGHSEHRPASSTYHLLDNIVDLAALVEKIAPDQGPVILLGHSMGGIICALYAAAMPGRVSRLIMLDSLGPMTDETESVLPQLRRAMERISKFKKSRLTLYPGVEMAAKVRTSGIGKISLGAAQRLVARGLKKVEGGYCWTSDPRLMEPSLVRFSEAQVETVFGGIECPVSLICGDKGYFADYDALRKRLSYIKDIEKHIVTGGHHFHMEGDVESTARLIHDFISG
ncbi:MAG: alpha/beta hydrolase [Oleiphilus sp.]|nr:MAG: alpha/beta hydrolase [Oleiphilus sp.]